MLSRLDRLFALLDTSSSTVTRSAAAKQFGEVQKLHPHELHLLLNRLLNYLYSIHWETRVAAAEAIRAIVDQVPIWCPVSQSPTTCQHYCFCQSDNCLLIHGKFQLSSFSLQDCLANEAHLLGSKDIKNDFDDNKTNINEKLKKQKEQINERLGLDILSKLGMDSTNELIIADDIMPCNDNGCGSSTSMESNEIDQIAGLSSRERNRAKRKARQQSSAISKMTKIQNNKKFKMIDVDRLADSYGVPDSTNVWPSTLNQWPLEYFCDKLLVDLFNSNWVVRHGAAMALRELVRRHGQSAGKFADLTAEEMENHHRIWIEDVVVRIVYVLTLDRFGDFVSDSVVAPVRETCSQCLATLVPLMQTEKVTKILDILLDLSRQSIWEIRHSGLLGVKYLLAVVINNMEFGKDLVAKSFTDIYTALSDSVDDVAAVAASTLLPVAEIVANNFPKSADLLLRKLWDLLLEQDDLTYACNSFMDLLSKLISFESVQFILRSENFVKNVPRLFPFLWHNSTKVRKCTLQTLQTLTNNINIQWEIDILQELLRYVYQLVILEQVEELKLISERIWLNVLRKSDLMVLLNAVCPLVNNWLALAMHPVKYPIDPSLLINTSNKKTTLNDSDSRVLISQSLKWYIGGNESISIDVRESNAVRSRLIACRMLGALSVYIVKEIPSCDSQEKPIECYVNILRVFLNSKSAMQRSVIGLVISEWSRQETNQVILPDSIKCDLSRCLNEFVYFDEIAGSFTSLMQDYRDFIATLRHYKIDSRKSELFNDCGTTVALSKILKNIGEEARKVIVEAKLRSNITDKLEDRRKSIEQLAVKTNQDQLDYSILSLSMISGAVIMFDILPENLNPVIKPLMKAIKHENCTDMQEVIAGFLAKLMQLCKNRDPCPNPKIINNLVAFLCSDQNRTPKLLQTTTDTDLYNGIITLRKQQKEVELLAVINKRTLKASDVNFNDSFDDELQKTNQNQSCGACIALKTIVSKFGDGLVTDLPRLWEFVYLELIQSVNLINFDLNLLRNQEKSAEKLINNLQVLEVVVDSLSKVLKLQIFDDIVPRLCLLLSHPYSAVRHMTSRCMASLAKLNPIKIMEAVVQNVITNLSANHDEIARQGAVEAIYQIIKTLFVEIVPFIVLLIVPLLGRMSDQNEPVRLLATQSFATLVQLLPLDSNNDSECLRQSFLYERRNHDRVFVEQLLSPKSIPNFVIPVEISVQLRSYQQAGVNWLAFLNHYKLHGILCDDMGLGKTLQSICILVSDHFHRCQKNSVDCKPCPSIVVCPATLTGHWFYEIKKFVLSDHLKPFQYVGSPAEREKSRKEYKKYNVIIVSYETLRKDIDFFKKIHWNYCILDEGHVIKNSKARVSIAVKSLQSNHRLILSGTPIQNNVLELWSLFDFLMPGFLGTEKQFYTTFSRPILASRDPKCTNRDQELGVLAMNALHRQVLPLVLRRMKEDVLDDLPPKITQDYYCELTQLQRELYEDFSKSSAHQMLQDSIKEVKDVNDKKLPMHGHIFRALHYLQNVCNHPKLVLNANHPQFEKIINDLSKKKQNLDQICHSAKLLALNQLLRECNIGDNSGSGNSPNLDETKELPVTNQHRALIFCQSKAMINIIEQDLFRTLMPDISMLRLDGSVPLSERHGIVTKFNNDPSIDVLLLTTQIGGLGLNLTGADTVIFVEHDWNPMKDLQAMDRAHRIGQKKVVNVYRLITRGTLEEKIMGLQKFKIQTANTIITSENESMQTMVTDQLFDLFEFNKETDDKRDESIQKTKSSNISKILESLPDLWNPNQYDNEYNMDQFLSKMNS